VSTVGGSHLSFIKLKAPYKGQTFFIVPEDDSSETSFGYIVEPRGQTCEYFYLFASEDDAGKHVREYWSELIQDDPREAVDILGADTLIEWALGRPAGPGHYKVHSLEEWLDLYLTDWHEHFEDYQYVDAISDDLEEAIGFKPLIACMM